MKKKPLFYLPFLCILLTQTNVKALPSGKFITGLSGDTCMIDTSQSNFQAGVLTNVELTSSPGDVKLANSSVETTDQNSLPAALSTTNNLSATTWTGQTFRAGISGNLTKITVGLGLASGTSGTITVEIRNLNGINPGTTILATSTLGPVTNVGSAALYTTTFSTPAAVVSGTSYSVVLRTSVGNTVFGVRGSTAGGSTLANGQVFTTTTSGATWTGVAADLDFTTYVTPPLSYQASGNLVSGLKDANPSAGFVPVWTTLSWTATTPASTGIQFQAAASNSSSGPFNFAGPDGTASTFFTNGALLSQFNGFRYLKYKALFTSAVTTSTPVLNDVTACVSYLPIPNASISSSSNVSCNGGSNGSATVTASGGAPGYTYSWSPAGGTAATATGLTAGSYTVTVTDANLLTTTATVTITEPPVLAATISDSTNVLCNGGSSGSATVTATGGTTPYTYLWSTAGGTEATVTGLAAGNYTVTITDSNSCITSATVEIIEPPVLAATISDSTNVSCNGGSNGFATVTASGGIGQYTYTWAPSGGTAATATDLAAGIYTVTVTDSNSCATTATVRITEPPVLSATSDSTNVSCNGGSNGSATVTVSGGIGQYTYSWSPSGGTAATASDLTAGTYTCTVTDSNTCSINKDVIIREPSAITADTSQTNVTCTGASTGTATVIASGGTGTKTYSWSPSGGSDVTANDLAAGEYTGTITDENLCSITKTFSITEPPSTPGANSYSLPASDQAVTNTVNNASFVPATCELVSTVLASGTSPVSGNVTNKVWIESAVPTDHGLPFVQRHYEITPATNASSATGTVTLYFTQDEFDNFNAHPGSNPGLPVNSTDNAGKANLRIGKYTGVSSDGTGLPSSYTGTAMVIDPDDNDIVWNAVSNSWEVTFAVDGFSGLIVQTSVSVLPVNWVSFTIKKQGQSVILKWSTAEQNTKNFSVQHSDDGITWKTVATVASEGNNTSVHNYTYVDNNTVKGYNYYRIMQTGLNGINSYSEMRVINLSGNYQFFTIQGNLVNNGVLKIQVHQGGSFSFYDITGKRLWVKQFAPGVQNIDVSRYAKGIYLLKTEGKVQKILLQ